MKKRFLCVCLGLALALTLVVFATLRSAAMHASSVPAGTVVSGKFLNPAQVALLYWYPANLTTKFAVGSEPFGVTFDGADIWVANNGSNNVTKLRRE